MVELVPRHEGRAALDLVLGPVVLLEAPPGVSYWKAAVVVLDAAPALEGAAVLNAVVQFVASRYAYGRLQLCLLLRGVKGTLRPCAVRFASCTMERA